MIRKEEKIQTLLDVRLKTTDHVTSYITKCKGETLAIFHDIEKKTLPTSVKGFALNFLEPQRLIGCFTAADQSAGFLQFIR